MKIIYKLNSRQIDELHSLYQQEWWTEKRSLVDTKKCIEGSQVIVALINNKGSLQGFARVLTDYIFKALIFDLIIVREQRGNGLGNTLIDHIKNHYQLQDVHHFELYCLPELINFYEKQGFDNLGNIHLMRYTKT